MRLTKLPPREQAPDVRNKNFFEVSQGYDAEMAMDEAKRCLNCKHKPCVAGCPVNVRIPEFIQLAAEGKFLEAYEVIRSTNALPAVCGRVCPQETQCEEKCVRGIKGEPVAIGRLERFVADYAMEHGCEPAKPLPDNGKKVAIVGSGPAGLTCAGDLRKLGYEVTIFEALHTPGGVLVYGIPEFRLPKQLVRDEIQTLQDIGVKIETNMVVGRSITLDELLTSEGTAPCSSAAARGFRAFRDSGENLNGVYSANEFLTRINLMKAYTFPKTDTPYRSAKTWPSSAAATWQWTRPEAQSGWARRTSTSSTAAARPRCPRVWRKCITPRGRHYLPHAHKPDRDPRRRKRARYRHDLRGDGVGEPDASGRRKPSLSPAASTTWMWTPSSSPSATAPIR
jgi:glutamate synthase (NADPH/NADH) small chain